MDGFQTFLKQPWDSNRAAKDPHCTVGQLLDFPFLIVANHLFSSCLTMTLRPPLPPLRRSLRAFATTPSWRAEATPPSSGFGALNDIFSPSPPSTTPTTSSSPHTGFARPQTTTTLTEATRGYERLALPPKSDPVLDMFTNLMMKHGRKAEAQSKMSRILAMLYVPQLTEQSPIPTEHSRDPC